MLQVIIWQWWCRRRLKTSWRNMQYPIPAPYPACPYCPLYTVPRQPPSCAYIAWVSHPGQRYAMAGSPFLQLSFWNALISANHIITIPQFFYSLHIVQDHPLLNIFKSPLPFHEFCFSPHPKTLHYGSITTMPSTSPHCDCQLFMNLIFQQYMEGPFPPFHQKEPQFTQPNFAFDWTLTLVLPLNLSFFLLIKWMVKLFTS